MPNKVRRSEPKGEELGARFSASQKKRVLAAVAKAKLSPSEFIRNAVLGKADAVLAEDLAASFSGFVALINDPTLAGRGRRQQYAAALAEKHAPDSRRTRQFKADETQSRCRQWSSSTPGR